MHRARTVGQKAGAGQVVEDPAHLLLGQDSGQPFRFFSAQGVNEAQVLFQHLVVKEQEGAEGLILCGCGDVFLHRQMSKEGFEYGRRMRRPLPAHFSGVTFVGEL